MPNMIEELLGHGFKLKGYNVGSHKIRCPRCSDSRNDKQDPCLYLTIQENEKALWKCYNCGWSGSAGAVHKGSREKTKAYRRPDLPAGAIGAMPEGGAKFLTGRKITRGVWERNKLFYNEETEALCFPFFSEGQIINVKSRKIKDKKFSLSTGAQLIFYGLDDLKGQETCIIVEGEMDKLALEVCGFINVISVPNGAPCKIKEGSKIENTGGYEYLAHAETIIRSLKKIIIAVDNDANGKILEYELARRIGPEKCYTVEFPVKDANDCLMEFDRDVVCSYINSAKPYPINGLYNVLDFNKSLFHYFNNTMKRGLPTGWATLDKFYSVPVGRITIVTGVPNAGKSEFLDALLWNLAKMNDWKFVLFSPENGKEAHVTKFIEKVIEKPTNPKASNRMSENEFAEGALVVARHFYFIVAEDMETLPTLDWILEKAKIAIYRYGVQGLVIDPYNEIEHTRAPGEQETEYISKMLSKLKKFAQTYSIHIWIVAHPAKQYKDKEGKYAVPSLYDIAGSAHFVNKTDFGIVVHRGEDVANVSEIHLKKVRFKHEGANGCCNLIYNKSIGTYSEPVKPLATFSLYEEPDEISYG